MFPELQSAAAEAQQHLAQLGGAQPGKKNIVGPDGRKYTGTFRAGTALDAAAAGSEMQAHGFADAEIVIVTITRDQFDAVPLGWRRQQLSRIDVSPPVVYRIASVATSDSLFFVFTLTFRQGAA